jgi:hypothetical protein
MAAVVAMNQRGIHTTLTFNPEIDGRDAQLSRLRINDLANRPAEDVEANVIMAIQHAEHPSDVEPLPVYLVECKLSP